MAGYIGSKAVNLSTTGADINGDANIDGTLTSDGLTVDNNTVSFNGTADQILNLYTSNTGADNRINFGDAGDADIGRIWYKHNGNHMQFYTNATERLKLHGNGDISFYEDTGTTAKFFWDASAESLGIGTSSPTRQLDVSKAGTAYIRASDTSSSVNMEMLAASSGGWVGTQSNHSLNFQTNNAEVMRIDSSGNVGIGTTSPSQSWTGGTARTIQLQGPSSTITVLRVNEASDTYGDLQLISGASNEVALYNFNNGAMRFGTNGNDRMRIDSSGQVGINTATPNNYYAKKLVIDIGSDVQNGMTIVSGTSASGMIAFADGTSGASAYRGYFNYSHASDYLAIGTAGTEAMRIDSSGNLLVGTSSSIAGNIQSLAAGDAITTRTTNSVGATNATAIGFQNASGSYSGAIYVNGSATTYATSSDHRLKENVVELTGATTRLKQLNPSRFNFITNADTTVDGFLAHEVQTVVPEAITGTHNEVDADGNPVYQGIDQSKLVPLLTAALQEALDEITDLKARVATLEAN